MLSFFIRNDSHKWILNSFFFFLLKRSDWVFTYELLCKEISFSDERIISFYEKSTWFFDCQSYVQIEMAKYWTMNEQFKMRIDWLLFSFIQFVTNIVNSLSICLAISISTLYVARYQDTTGRKSNEHSTYTHTHTHPYVCASWKRQNKLLELKCRCALFELQSTTIGILYRYSIHIIHNAHTYIDDDVCKLCTKKKIVDVLWKIYICCNDFAEITQFNNKVISKFPHKKISHFHCVNIKFPNFPYVQSVRFLARYSTRTYWRLIQNDVKLDECLNLWFT